MRQGTSSRCGPRDSFLRRLRSRGFRTAPTPQPVKWTPAEAQCPTSPLHRAECRADETHATWLLEAIGLVMRRTGKPFGIARAWLLKSIESNPGFDKCHHHRRQARRCRSRRARQRQGDRDVEDPEARDWKSGLIGDMTGRTAGEASDLQGGPSGIAGRQGDDKQRCSREANPLLLVQIRAPVRRLPRQCRLCPGRPNHRRGLIPALVRRESRKKASEPS
jgi:hypothetical protein